MTYSETKGREIIMSYACIRSKYQIEKIWQTSRHELEKLQKNEVDTVCAPLITETIYSVSLSKDCCSSSYTGEGIVTLSWHCALEHKSS